MPRLETAVLLRLLLSAACLGVGGADEAGEKMFAEFVQSPAALQAVRAYTVDPLSDEECGLYIHYGTRLLLDFDVTEIVDDGTEKVPAGFSPSALLLAAVQGVQSLVEQLRVNE